jgi:hypothetical protein
MDLAKRQLRGTSIPRPSGGSTIPSAAPVAPQLEINTPLYTPDPSRAEALANILGVVNDVGQQVSSDLKGHRDEEAEAQAALDFSAGAKNDSRFADSRAYRDAWQREGAKKLSVDISTAAHQAVTERLSDPDNPATLADVDGAIEGVFRQHIMDRQGKLIDFGTVEAKRILAQSMTEIRDGLLPQAAAAIKAQTDNTFLTTWANNTVHELYRGVPIGADPLAPLPDAVAAPVEPKSGASVAPQGSPPAPARFDFEAALSRVPSSIDKAVAKQFLLQSLFNAARERSDPSLLDRLEESKRRDGTPSLTPEDIGKLQEFRNQLTTEIATKATQAREALWHDNADAILLAFESDKPPSIAFVQDAAHKGLIDPQFAFTMQNWVVNQQQEAEDRARTEQREARAEADAQFDADVSGRIAERQPGLLGDASPQGDLQLLNSGQLGTGKKALARYRELRAAAHAGELENLRRPETAQYAYQLQQTYGKTPTDLVGKALVGPVNYGGMIAYYRSEVAKGTEPAQAYSDTVRKFGATLGSKEAEQRRLARIAELKAKQALPDYEPIPSPNAGVLPRLRYGFNLLMDPPPVQHPGWMSRAADSVNTFLDDPSRTLGVVGPFNAFMASGIASILRIPDQVAANKAAADAAKPKPKPKPAK